ncbi:hypothetical protein AB0B66_10775 [Catellatospora sp. NPDC049111]|uniref:MmyB family transcriptional regulator n=1 Tax=Catellatospora sp. NPDC049111 TaxID=3155271 RepID=UPI0033F84143
MDPATVIGLVRDNGDFRRRLSQEEVAQLVGSSARWYGFLDRGDLSHSYSDDFLDRVSVVLRLSPDERKMLYLLAQGRDPAPAVPTSTPSVTRAVRQMLDSTPWPAWVSDVAWDILALNQAALDWLPHLAYELNVMRWVWLYGEARERLTDFETVWSPRMLGQLRIQVAKLPDDPRLISLLDEVLRADATAGANYSSAQLYSHPDGDLRRLKVPFREEPVWVEVVAANLLREGDLRLLWLVPTEPDMVDYCHRELERRLNEQREG